MDADLCREHLRELVHEELASLRELKKLLDAERAVLASNDLKALQRSTTLRQERIGQLAHIEEQRRSLITLHGETADGAGLERLLKWCDPRGLLGAALGECRRLAGACRELNDRNALLVSALLKRVNERLQALSGRTQRGATYGPHGDLDHARQGRVLRAV